MFPELREYINETSALYELAQRSGHCDYSTIFSSIMKENDFFKMIIITLISNFHLCLCTRNCMESYQHNL